MRILIDILHPAHVHFFRNFIAEAEERGDQVLVTSRDKDVAGALLNAFEIEHQTISTKKIGRRGLTVEWAARTARLFGIARKFGPDVLMGIMGVSIAPVGRLLRRPAVVFYDTEVARRTNSFVYPMATAVVTPDCYEADLRPNQVTYAGYHELAYLHPSQFSPDARVLGQFDLSKDQQYAIVRFVDQDSSHDGSEIALTASQKVHLVESISAQMRVVISSEGELPSGLRRLRLTGPVHQVHHALAFADMYVGESATMASEAAMLSTPATFIGQTSRGYVNELCAKYQLIERFLPAEAESATEAAIASVANAQTDSYRANHSQMLADKVDVTSWIEGFMNRYR